jgi:ABC-type lipoprotein release transport system permease subunit
VTKRHHRVDARGPCRLQATRARNHGNPNRSDGCTSPIRSHISSLRVIVVAGLFAAWIPASRAAKVDPMKTLRQE